MDGKNGHKLSLEVFKIDEVKLQHRTNVCKEAFLTVSGGLRVDGKSERKLASVDGKLFENLYPKNILFRVLHPLQNNNNNNNNNKTLTRITRRGPKLPILCDVDVMCPIMILQYLPCLLFL